MSLDSEEAVERLFLEEYKRLDGVTYLDHTGAGQYSSSQLAACTALLSSTMFGNPHTTSGPSERTTYGIQKAREAVLAHFKTTEANYTVVFTSGATESIKKVGELFPWCAGRSRLCYTSHNHTSCVGLRAIAASNSVEVSTVDPPLSGLTVVRQRGTPCVHELSFQQPPRIVYPADPTWRCEDIIPDNLFVLSGECNFSGVKTDLRVVPALQSGAVFGASACDSMCSTCGQRVGKWRVLLDAAKLASSSELDLSSVQPDFVTISFYKMFGYPTGLGALLIRNDIVPSLRKGYFGGGTVLAASADSNFAMFRKVKAATYKDARHSGVIVYGNHEKDNAEMQGPILTFNVRLRDGSFVSPSEVVRVAGLNNIVMRAGCFCNPGACQRFLGINDTDVRKNFDMGHVCWDGNDVINGRPIGAVRASFSFMTRRCDIDALINVLTTFYFSALGDPVSTVVSPVPLSTAPPVLTSITVLPVKSCGGFCTPEWPLGPCGLLYDREWCITDAKGLALTQKTEPRLVLVHARIELIDAISAVLTLSAEGFGSVSLTVTTADDDTVGKYSDSAQDVEVTVCGEECRGIAIAKPSIVSDPVTAWLAKVLQRPCMLVRRRDSSPHSSPDDKPSGRGKNGTVGFANDAPFLLISQDSTDDVYIKMKARYEDKGEAAPITEVTPSFFRPNLVVSGSAAPFDEDAWKTIAIGPVSFDVVGKCARCRMINIDQEQESGEDRPKGEPLLTLSKYRRTKAGVFFGVFLRHTIAADGCEVEVEAAPVMLRVGDTVVVKLRYEVE